MIQVYDPTVLQSAAALAKAEQFYDSTIFTTEHSEGAISYFLFHIARQIQPDNPKPDNPKYVTNQRIMNAQES